MNDSNTVWINSKKTIGCGTTGGGFIASVYTPSFAGAGATLEVRALAADGGVVKSNSNTYTMSYPLTATACGVLGLSTAGTGSAPTWMADWPDQAVGFIAYARGAAVTVGRGGESPNNPTDGLYIKVGAPQDEALAVGQCGAWALVADAHGWSFPFIDDGQGGGGGGITGWLPFFLGTSGLTALQLVKGSTSLLGGWNVMNLNSVPAFLEFFDAATTGAVTLGTTVPIFELPLMANSTAAQGITANLEIADGVQFLNGIVIACTTASGGNTTSVTGLAGSIQYK